MPQATQILDDQFLLVRAKLIEVAAVLDRLDRAAADGLVLDLDQHPKRAGIEQAIQTLLAGACPPGGRTEAIQQLFSRRYEPSWREAMDL